MRSLVYLLIFLFYSIHGLCQGYQLQASPDNSQVDIYLFSQQMNDFNFIPMDISYRGSFFGNDVDQIYFDRNNHQHYAVLKFDLSYLGKKGVMQLSEKDYVCHGQFSNGRPFALFSTGIEKNRMQKICHQTSINQNHSSRNYLFKSNVFASFFLPQALAQSTCPQKNSFSSLKVTSSIFTSEMIIQKIGSCVADALRGAKGSLGGMLSGVKNLFTTSPKELWSELKQNVSGISQFVLNIKNEMIKLKKSLSQLDFDLILSLGCQIGGEIITSMGVSALTGAGITMLSKRMVELVSRTGKLNHLFERLNKLSRFGNKKLAEKVLSCGLK